MPGDDAGNIKRGRKQVIHKSAVEELAVIVEDQLLVEGVADPLGHPTLHLTFEDERVNDGAAVVNDHVFFDLDAKGLRIDLNDHGMDTGGSRPAGRAQIDGSLQT